MQPKNGILIYDSMSKGADENKTPPKYINWPNETVYVTIFYDNRHYWLTIYIWFAPLFCKSQKWVAVATVMCYLACWKEKTKTKQKPQSTF